MRLARTKPNGACFSGQFKSEFSCAHVAEEKVRERENSISSEGQRVKCFSIFYGSIYSHNKVLSYLAAK